VPYQFCQAIVSCATLEAVQRTFRHEIARHGFSTSALREVVAAPGGSESRFLFRDWPGRWHGKFKRMRLGSDNFAVTEARRRTTPFTWRDIRKARAFSPGEERTWGALCDFGWRDGFVVPTHGPRGSLATVGMGTVERDVYFSPAQRLRLQMIALAVHERARVLSGAIAVEPPCNTLTARELECLRWVADGKTDWEISMILSISSATVKFHLDRARVKLNAVTRAQAVARLVLSGLH